MSEKRLEKIQQEIQEELLRELEQGVSFSDEQMQDEIEIRVLKRGQMEYLTIEEKMELVKQSLILCAGWMCCRNFWRIRILRRS